MNRLGLFARVWLALVTAWWDAFHDAWMEIGEAYAQSQGFRFDDAGYAGDVPYVEHVGSIERG